MNSVTTLKAMVEITIPVGSLYPFQPPLVSLVSQDLATYIKLSALKQLGPVLLQLYGTRV
jgi:hypothetical protein